MTNANVVEIASEIARIFIYGEQWRNNMFRCERCGIGVPAVTTAVAAVLDKTTVDVIRNRVASGELHDLTDLAGTPHICLSSLLFPEDGTAIEQSGSTKETSDSADPRLLSVCLNRLRC